MVDYKKEKIDDYVVYRINGEFIIGQIGDILDDYTKEIRSEQVKFIFDFQKIKMIDSSGLGTILMGASQVMEKGEKIKICFDVSNKVIRELFSVINLDNVMEYYGSIEDAKRGQNKVSV